MKAVRFILVGMFVVIVGILAVGALLSSKWQVSQTIQIEAPAATVFAELNSPQRWEYWMTWAEEAGAGEFTYSEVKSGVGAVVFFGNDASGMTRKITASDPYRRVAYVMTNPNIGRAHGELLINTVDGVSTVTWNLQGELRGPIEKFLMATLVKSRLNHVLSGSLANLKQNLVSHY